MSCFKIVIFDAESGSRSYLPWEFRNPGEALEKITELIFHDPDQNYIIMLSPLGEVG